MGAGQSSKSKRLIEELEKLGGFDIEYVISAAKEETEYGASIISPRRYIARWIQDNYPVSRYVATNAATYFLDKYKEEKRRKKRGRRKQKGERK